jgi:hypothetical protein
MSIIKEIYDVAKDGTNLLAKKVAIKRALKTELKLNRKFLADIENGRNVEDHRRIEIIQMLEFAELASAVKYEIPYLAISNKKITDEMARTYKISKLNGDGIEEVIEKLFLMVSYLKKDYKNKNISLNLRLLNIYKYNRVLIELLS